MPATQPTDQQLDHFLTICQQAARAGGERLNHWMGRAEVFEKGPRDFVTEADLDAQRVIQAMLLEHFPDHQFIGEESKNAQAIPSDASTYCWIVDPLDGTTNFIHGLRSFAVSIALFRDGQLIVGTVYDPMLDECFSAVAGQGATLNGNPIRPSGCEQMQNALMVFSLPAGTKKDDPQVMRFLNVVEHAASLRRLGSAALNLCYVACGRTDGYWASNLKSWDVAAGWLILQEAGGAMSGFDGSAPDLNAPNFCCATNETLLGKLRPLLEV